MSEESIYKIVILLFTSLTLLKKSVYLPLHFREIITNTSVYEEIPFTFLSVGGVQFVKRRKFLLLLLINVIFLTVHDGITHFFFVPITQLTLKADSIVNEH